MLVAYRVGYLGTLRRLRPAPRGLASLGYLRLGKNGLIVKFSLTYFLLLAPLVYVQIKTVATLLKLNSKLLRELQPQSAALEVKG